MLCTNHTVQFNSSYQYIDVIIFFIFLFSDTSNYDYAVPELGTAPLLPPERGVSGASSTISSGTTGCEPNEVGYCRGGPRSSVRGEGKKVRNEKTHKIRLSLLWGFDYLSNPPPPLDMTICQTPPHLHDVSCICCSKRLKKRYNRI